jgi:hypothetical protein
VSRLARTHRLLTLALLVLAELVAGCATPASPQGMAAGDTIRSSRLAPYTVDVVVTGGSATNPLATVAISNDDLRTAIETSIRASGTFREVLRDGQGDYRLAVMVIQLQQPVLGLNARVDLELGWTLVRASDRQVVYRKAILSSYTATMGDAFVGVRRAQLGVEGAARANIAQALAGIAGAGF